MTDWNKLAEDANIVGGQGHSSGDVAETGYLVALFWAIAVVVGTVALLLFAR